MSIFFLWIFIYCAVFMISSIFQIVRYPFDVVRGFAETYPLQTTRSVIGFITGLLISVLFDLPYEFSISFFGATTSVILGEIL